MMIMINDHYQDDCEESWKTKRNHSHRAHGSVLDCNGKDWKSDTDNLADIHARRELTKNIGCSHKKENKSIHSFGSLGLLWLW